MYYPDSGNSKEMSDRVHTYVNRVKKYGNTYSNQCLLENIREMLFEFAYYVPQTRLGLAEEDSSAFVLYVMEGLEAILLKYRNEANDFYAYFSAVLDNKVRTFYRNRKSEERKERSAVTAQSLCEVHMFPTNNSYYLSVSENSASGGGTKMAQKLRFLALKSKTTQRRLFVYLLSIALFIPISTLKDLCCLLEIDFNQTSKIANYIEKLNLGYVNQYNYLTSRRDRLFCRSLEIENEITVHNYFCDYGKANEKLLKLQKLRQEINNKNEQIDRVNLHISYKTLAAILRTNKQSIACSTYYSKNLLSWCEDPSLKATCSSLGIGDRLIQTILSGEWEHAKVKVNHLSVLYPEQTFDVNFKLNL